MHVVSVATRSLKGRSNNGQVATTATGGITVTVLATHLSERSGGASHVFQSKPYVYTCVSVSLIVLELYCVVLEFCCALLSNTCVEFGNRGGLRSIVVVPAFMIIIYAWRGIAAAR